MTSSTRNAVLVAGSANLDFVVRAAHVPAPGETVLGRELSTFPGGKGANQAVACARAGGIATQMLLALGNDAYATPLEDALRAAGVELHVVRTIDQATGTAFICLADDAENAITVAPGANNTLRAAHLPALASISHLLLQLETPLDSVTAYALAAQAAGVRVVLNAAPARALPPDLFGALDVLIVNEGELATLSGGYDSIAAAMQRLALPCVIVTLGARGVVARVREEFHVQCGFPVDAVDTTGAGDTFCGVITAALCQGLSLPQALRRATAASALACMELGAQSSIPSHAKVETFLGTERATDSPQQRQALAAYCGIN